MSELNGRVGGDPLVSQVTSVPKVWDPEEDDVLVCRQVRAETHDVKTFLFSAREPRLFRFKPGQFLTLDLEINGATIQRCYTISSSPARPHLVSITVKRVPGGPVSNWLHDTMAPGKEIRAVGPLGEFTAFDHPAPKYLFLSGGSGITPLMSMARAFHDLSEPCDIVFVHAARTPADIIFRTELDLLARNMPGFKVVHVVEGEGGEPGWAGLRGRLSKEMLAVVAPDFAERTVFTCGPSPFMAAVRTILGASGFDMARYHEESFNFEELSPTDVADIAEAQVAAGEVPAADAAPTVQTFRVEFRKSGKVIECAADRFVLDAARLAGMRLPSSCTKGLCGTCKSKLLEGKVDMQHQGGIRQREIDAGMALLCCAKPLTDLVVDR